MKYFVIEGIDGSGKSTFINLLKEELEKEGKKVCLIKEPLDRELIKEFLNKKIEDIILNELKNVFVFCLDRVFVNEKIKKLMDKNEIIISDRSFVSSMAYQFDLDLEWIYEVNKNFLKPDLIIYLNVNIETALERIKKREKEKEEGIKYFEKRELLERISRRYIETLNFLEKKGFKIKIIDGNKNLDEIKKEIVKLKNEGFFDL